MLNVSNQRKRNETGTIKMFDYAQRATTPEYRAGWQRIFGNKEFDEQMFVDSFRQELNKVLDFGELNDERKVSM